jgi:hypothetical protein
VSGPNWPRAGPTRWMIQPMPGAGESAYGRRNGPRHRLHHRHPAARAPAVVSGAPPPT